MEVPLPLPQRDRHGSPRAGHRTHRKSSSVSPAITRAATFASCTPVALATKSTVLDARVGFNDETLGPV